MIRRFVLDRKEDETGISGTGVVAEGAQFSSGACVITWLTVITSITVYTAIEDVIAIHGHNGKTVVRWQDDENYFGAVTVQLSDALTEQQADAVIERIKNILMDAQD